MRKHITILAVLAAVITGFGYYTLFSTPAHDSQNQIAKGQDLFAVENDQLDEEVVKPRQGQGTLQELRMLKENLECTVRFDAGTAGSRVEGTYFVSEGSMRGDFLTDSPDLSGKILSSMIIKGEIMYSWSEIDGQMYGVKIDLSQVEEAVIDDKSAVSINESVKYDCKPWENVDGAIFLPPGNVLFQDLSEIMNIGMEYGNIYEEGG